MHALAALADPTRRRIVELLAARDRTAGEIVAEFDMTAPAISQHLKVLRRAGLVSVRVEGQHRVQMLNPVGLVEIETWLARTTRAWMKRSVPKVKGTRPSLNAPGKGRRQKAAAASSPAPGDPFKERGQLCS
jgi:DNA-binding transcriptional ArsR family regulator